MKKIFKEVKRIMNEKIKVCKDVLTSKENRAVVGIIVIGLGVGLVVSAYIPMPS